MEIRYFKSVKDKNGCVHSIDNVVGEYYLMCGNCSTALEQIRILAKESRVPSDEYWEMLNRPGCSKWNFYKDHIHMSDAYIKMGHYQDFDKLTRTWTTLPLISIEVNPNKHSEEEWFKRLMIFIREWCNSGVAKRIDYAIDIPTLPSNVQVFSTRKERGLHKGTRYFGQRNKNGYCKIYDKQKEQELEYPLTRVEHTLKVGDSLSLEEVMLLDIKSLKIENTSELNGTDIFIVESLRRMRANGIECDDIFQKLGRRKIEKLEKHITGNYVPLEYGEYLTELMTGINELFNFSAETRVNIIADKDGYLQVDNDNPFEI